MFLPRSKSKTVFILAMTCYALAATRLLGAIARAFGAPGPPLGVFQEHGHHLLEAISLLLFAPVVESLVLIGIIELLRKLRAPVWLQITFSALVGTFLHIPVSYALVVVPAWFIMSAAYVMWRRESWKIGFVIIASIHALLNLNSAIWVISDAIQRANA